jgi:hypothetical protein
LHDHRLRVVLEVANESVDNSISMLLWQSCYVSEFGIDKLWREWLMRK